MAIIVALVFGIVAALADVTCYLMYKSATISSLSIPFLIWRFGLAYAGALIVGWRAKGTRFSTWLALAGPPLFVGEALFLYELGGVSNLWPPILFIDVLLFVVCLPIMAFGGRLAGARATQQTDE